MREQFLTTPTITEHGTVKEINAFNIFQVFQLEHFSGVEPHARTQMTPHIMMHRYKHTHTANDNNDNIMIRRIRRRTIIVIRITIMIITINSSINTY